MPHIFDNLSLHLLPKFISSELRGNDAEYKHVVLGLTFLKYTLDGIEERRR